MDFNNWSSQYFGDISWSYEYLAEILGVDRGAVLAPLCILLSALIASVVASISMRHSRILARKKNSMDFITHYNDSEKIDAAEKHILKIFHTIEEKNFSAEEYMRSLIIDVDKADDSELAKEIRLARKNVGLVLNYYESMAICVFNDIYDSRIVKKTMYSTVKTIWLGCKPYIDERRREANKPSYYQEIELLVKEWGEHSPSKGPQGLSKYKFWSLYLAKKIVITPWVWCKHLFKKS
ncbi:DUF4760 domain-containing protein [Alteromonas sp. 345S023]|uniref:DUF4760 domain-containing protein n=1 Tax=Alteromonas profundi TaxID=2696062 RepID=A0A7X5LPE6_9ALTE|nr:DUF4760 domain-containing protein [Alteromonas profundi]NDV93084.1 DUF4760 domain-containing protein [Alteromonas profundi]